MKIVQLYGEHLKKYKPMDPFDRFDVLAMPKSFALGAAVEIEENKSKPVGVLVAEETDDRLEIVWMYVSPKFRGKGVGSSLMKMAFEEALARGLSQVGARISDEFDTLGLPWFSDLFFVNDVFSGYEDSTPETVFLVSDMSGLLFREDEANEKAIKDKRLIPLKNLKTPELKKLNEDIAKAYGSLILTPVDDVIRISDGDLSFVLYENESFTGAFFIRHTGVTWYTLALVGKNDEDLDTLIRAALYYSEDITRPNERVCVSPNRQQTAGIFEKFDFKGKTYGVHYIVAKMKDYIKQKNSVAV